MSAAYTLISWGVTLALVLGAIHIYNPTLAQKLLGPSNTVQSHPAPSVQQQTTKRPKATKASSKQNTLTSLSSTENLSTKEARTSKKRKIATSSSDTTTKVDEKDPNQDGESTINDSDFAQQLKKAQSGTKLQSKSQPKPPAPNGLAENKKNVVSHVVGVDANTDAGENHPTTSATARHAASSKDVSDMLEAPAAGPATLRLTNVPTESKPLNQTKKQFEQVQSKKKRNEQKRREEQKREIEESNQLWEKKKQEQLRTARLAAGTSNQIKADAFTNTANAWQKKSQAPSSEEKSATAGPLLDTFEMANAKETAPSVQTASMNSIASKSLNSNNVNALKTSEGEGRTSALAASGREQGSSMMLASQMSEEEQIQRLRDQDKEEVWEAVTSKKTKKKNKPENDTSSDTSSVPPPVRSTVSKPDISKGKTNGVTKPKEDTNRFQSIQTTDSSGLQDDEWAA